jgi:hypothetical protein
MYCKPIAWNRIDAYPQKSSTVEKVWMGRMELPQATCLDLPCGLSNQKVQACSSGCLFGGGGAWELESSPAISPSSLSWSSSEAARPREPAEVGLVSMSSAAMAARVCLGGRRVSSLVIRRRRRAGLSRQVGRNSLQADTRRTCKICCTCQQNR